MSLAFGRQLRQLRHSRHLTQRDVAAAIGRSHSLVSGWEAGSCEPTVQDLIALAEYFQVGTDYLLGRIRAYTLMDDFARYWQTNGDKIAAVTLIKKFTPQNIEMLNRIIAAYYDPRLRTPELYGKIFQSVGYRIDQLRDGAEEELDFDLPEQRRQKETLGIPTDFLP